MTVMIEIKGVKLTVDEARAAYRELHKLFGSQEVRQPSIFDKVMPSGPSNPYPPYDSRVHEWLKLYTGSPSVFGPNFGRVEVISES